MLKMVDREATGPEELFIDTTRRKKLFIDHITHEFRRTEAIDGGRQTALPRAHIIMQSCVVQNLGDVAHIDWIPAGRNRRTCPRIIAHFA